MSHRRVKVAIHRVLIAGTAFVLIGGLTAQAVGTAAAVAHVMNTCGCEPIIWK